MLCVQPTIELVHPQWNLHNYRHIGNAYLFIAFLYIVLMKRVGIWIRVSTEDQAQGDSPKHHEQRARMYADLKEWDVVDVYHLEGVSGKNVGGHSETSRMIAVVSRMKVIFGII